MPNQFRQSPSMVNLVRLGMLAAVVLLSAVAGVIWLAQDDDPDPAAIDETQQAERPGYVDLVAPFDPSLGDTGPLLHLRVEPAAPGENALAVFVTEPTEQLGQDPVRRLLAPETTVDLTLTSLNQDQPPVTSGAVFDDAGGFVATELDLTSDGWWRFDVSVIPPGASAIQQSFVLLLPDPNVHGSDAARQEEDGGDDAAPATFERGLSTLTGLHRLRYEERLADGNGHIVIGQYALSDGTDGRPPALSIESARTALIRVGDREWLRRGDGEWTERTAATIFVPADFAETYEGATDLRLGRTEVIDGEPSRIVTFYVPDAPRRAEAWYAWWVGEETGTVRQEVMVARSHYMVHRFGDFNGDFAIEPPVPAGAGTATPEPTGGPAATSSLTTAFWTNSRHKTFTVSG